MRLTLNVIGKRTDDTINTQRDHDTDKCKCKLNPNTNQIQMQIKYKCKPNTMQTKCKYHGEQCTSKFLFERLHYIFQILNNYLKNTEIQALNLTYRQEESQKLCTLSVLLEIALIDFPQEIFKKSQISYFSKCSW